MRGNSSLPRCRHFFTRPDDRCSNNDYFHEEDLYFSRTKKKRKRKRNSLTPSPPPSPPSPFLLLERILFSPLFPKLGYLFDLFFFFFISIVKYFEILIRMLIGVEIEERQITRDATISIPPIDQNQNRCFSLPSPSPRIFSISISRFFEKLDKIF